jgi:branched-chain amino acid transport system ATP-binding protein
MPADAPRAVLRARGVAARHGRLVVTSGIDADVAPGEVLAVIGPNGAGKTSFAGFLAGVVRGEGSVVVDGRELTRSSPHARAKRGLLFVPEHRALFGRMTVRDNLALGSRLASPARRALLRAAALEHFPVLESRMDQRADTLSGGEQQMLAIAKALAADPHVLILDEPTQGLAPRVLDVVAATLRARTDHGLAVVLVEQNQAFAARVADRYLVINGGHVVHEGPSDELRDREALAARYLGRERAHRHGTPAADATHVD